LTPHSFDFYFNFKKNLMSHWKTSKKIKEN
jgi:hypothetical protein